MQESNSTQLAQVLRRERLRHHLTIRGLAARSGMPQTTLFYLESGKTASPKPDHLRRLAVVLEIDIEDLYEAAGYGLEVTLPALPSYLRTKYGLTYTAARQVEGYVQALRDAEEQSTRKEVRHDESGDQDT